MEALKIADEIISGRRLKREDNLNFLLEANLNVLCEGANKIREALCKKHVDLCSIINGRAEIFKSNSLYSYGSREKLF